VIFNEEEFFNGDIQSLKDDLLHTGIEELTELLKRVALPELEQAEDLPEFTGEGESEFAIPIGLDIALGIREEDSQEQCLENDLERF
jgi:hypothetical protein